MCKSLCRFFIHGASVFGHQMLREIGDHGIFRRRYIAPARFALACQDFQKGGFPCTVFSHQGYPVFLIDLKGNIFKEGSVTEFYRKSVN